MFKKILHYLVPMILATASLKAQVITAQRIVATENFRAPLDTLINPQYIWEVRFRPQDTSWYTAQAMIGQKWLKTTVPSANISGGTGTVTAVNAGYGISGGNITTSGTHSVDTTSISTKANAQKVVNDSSAILRALANTKQATLVSGTNIKTINGVPILGSGDTTVSDFINAKQYGAKGDGSTDDSKALVLAYAAARTQGKDLFIPGGTYVLNSFWNLDGSANTTNGIFFQMGNGSPPNYRNVRVFGEAKTKLTSSLSTNGASGQVIYFQCLYNTSGVTFENIFFESTHSITTNQVVAVQYSVGSAGSTAFYPRVANCRFEGFSPSIQLNGTVNPIITGNVFNAPKGREQAQNNTNPACFITMSSTNTGAVINPIITNNFANGYSGTASITTMTQRAIMDNFVQGDCIGGLIANNVTINLGTEHIIVAGYNGSGQTNAPLLITGNVIDCSIPSGTWALQTSTPLTNTVGIRADKMNVNISNNFIYNATWGILLYGANYPSTQYKNTVVSNNSVFMDQGANNTSVVVQTGIQVQGFNNASFKLLNGMVTGNQIVFDSTTLRGTAQALSLNDCTGILARDNTMIVRSVTKGGNNLYFISATRSTGDAVRNIVQDSTILTSYISSTSSTINRYDLQWGTIGGTLSNQADLQAALNAKQNNLTLTTTGTSGAATLVGSTLNIPQYSGGGSGITALTGDVTASGSGSVAATIANGAVTVPKLATFKTYPAERQLGTTYEKYGWTGAEMGADFSPGSSITMALNGNYPQLTSSTIVWGGTAITRFLPSNPSLLPYKKIECDYKIVSSLGSNIGFGVSFYSNNTAGANWGYTTYLASNASPGTPHLAKQDGTLDQTGTNISFSVGDVIRTTLEFKDSVVVATFQNLTTAGAVTTITKTLASNTTPYTANTGTWALQNFSGTYEVQRLKVSSTSTINPTLMVAFDSKGQINANNFASRFSSLLNLRYPTVLNYSGGGDMLKDFIDKRSEINRINPEQVLIGLGSNDLRYGNSLAVTEYRVDQIVNMFSGSSTKLAFTIIPEDSTGGGTGTGIGLTALKNYLSSTYPSNYIDLWTFMSTSNVLKSTYNSGEGIHPNNAGHKVIDSLIAASGFFSTQSPNRYTPYKYTDGIVVATGDSIHLDYKVSRGANFMPRFNDSLNMVPSLVKDDGAQVLVSKNHNATAPASGALVTVDGAMAFKGILGSSVYYDRTNPSNWHGIYSNSNNLTLVYNNSDNFYFNSAGEFIIRNATGFNDIGAYSLQNAGNSYLNSTVTLGYNTTGASTDSFLVKNGGDIKMLAAPLQGSAALNFPSTNAQNSSDLTITVTGAADGDVVELGVPNAAVLTNSNYTAWVSATNTVTVRFNNYSSGAQDPASGTFKVRVVK